MKVIFTHWARLLPTYQRVTVGLFCCIPSYVAPVVFPVGVFCSSQYMTQAAHVPEWGPVERGNWLNSLVGYLSGRASQRLFYLRDEVLDVERFLNVTKRTFIQYLLCAAVQTVPRG